MTDLDELGLPDELSVDDPGEGALGNGGGQVGN